MKKVCPDVDVARSTLPENWTLVLDEGNHRVKSQECEMSRKVQVQSGKLDQDKRSLITGSWKKESSWKCLVSDFKDKWSAIGLSGQIAEAITSPLGHDGS